MLAKRGRGVKVELVTHSNGELAESDFEAFGAQCGKFTKAGKSAKTWDATT